jgi:hypothetical protein
MVNRFFVLFVFTFVYGFKFSFVLFVLFVVGNFQEWLIVVIVVIWSFVVVVVVMYRSLDVRSRRGWGDNRDSGVGQEVIKFIGIDVIVGVVGFKNVGGGVCARMEITIVFGVVDRVVGAAFNNEAAGLDEGLAFFESDGFDASDSGVGHGEDNPLVAGNASAARKGQKIVVTGRVAGGVESNSADGTRLGRVGGVVIFEHLNVGAELKFEFVEVGGRDPGNKGRGAEGVGDAVDTGKTVEFANDIVNHMLDK